MKLVSSSEYVRSLLQPMTIYYLNDDLYRELGIPKICPINDQLEIWAYAIFDRDKELTEKHRYLISNYARIYDTKKRRLLKAYGSGVWEHSHRYQYQTISFRIPKSTSGYTQYLLHRLVALSFYPVDKSRPFVNHKDGCPEHNYLWNLEWSNHSENMLHAIRTGLKNEPRGEQRSNSLWTDDEIRLICKMMEEGHKATYIYNTLVEILKDPKVQYERVRALYKHIIHRTHWTHISKDYNIDFSSNNYKKELGSTEAAKTRDKHIDYPLDKIIFDAKALN